ncbi:hypothetical protein WR25_19025 [Diploscapter pachys]|uniref:Lysozyme n=1 Tax=Diploscapter pachys TaxID=2018661 RepID=A0A2A2JK14_9BILA|nr:hypothetical protein WR25_19025 [Diploscapter pachys]
MQLWLIGLSCLAALTLADKPISFANRVANTHQKLLQKLKELSANSNQNAPVDNTKMVGNEIVIEYNHPKQALNLKLADKKATFVREEEKNPAFVPPAPVMTFKKQEPEPAPAIVPPSQLAAYAYAVDFAQVATVAQMQCLRQNSYSTAFVRAYNPAGQGSFDANSCTNINNAYSAGLGIEIYMTPQPMSSKTGYQQLDEVYNGLNSRGITVRAIWIQVTSPINWPTNSNTNINFINSIIARARQYSLSVGIYTSAYDWNQITGGWTGAGNDVMLWYWNVRGGGVSGESPPNFSDFAPFGCWNSPTAKQFAQVEQVCSITVNRDVYMSGSAVAQVEGMAHREVAQEKEGMAKWEKAAALQTNQAKPKIFVGGFVNPKH